MVFLAAWLLVIEQDLRHLEIVDGQDVFVQISVQVWNWSCCLVLQFCS